MTSVEERNHDAVNNVHMKSEAPFLLMVMGAGSTEAFEGSFIRLLEGPFDCVHPGEDVGAVVQVLDDECLGGSCARLHRPEVRQGLIRFGCEVLDTAG